MLINPVKRRFLKISAYTFGSIIVLFVGFHFWFINHAEQILEDLVASRSNGKLKLKVKKFKFNWFSNNMQLRNAVFYSTDSTTVGTGYRFAVERINIRVKEVFPLIFEKKILIDSLGLLNPDIQVTRLRSVKRTDTTSYTEASLPHEMGKVYNSIQDALQILQVNRFQVHNGKFTLINKIKKDQLPVTITNINFHLDNLQVDSSDANGKRKILFSDNVSLNTHDQDILFADGRHRLSFSRFRINILEKMVLFDSCTISATKGDSTRNSFSVFFDQLRLTNIDFDTLYQKEVIKADSVYCINPRFTLDVELDKRKGKKDSPPRLDELIQQLTGDLRLAFVIVNNGSFDINTMREGRPSSFTSDHNNFEMRGLSIEKNSPRHVTVKSFAMAIRNYENFLRDSTYIMQFDSILFINNSVYLSNFAFRQMDNDKVINSFSMPQFELKGLSWDDLVFERSLAADHVKLYRPVINYSVLKNQKQNIFQTLADIGKIIQLQNLDMSNGQINIHFTGGTQLQLENADMSLSSQDLLQSKRISSLQRSIRQLRFKKGILKTPKLIVEMENANFSGQDGSLTAHSITLFSKEKKPLVYAKNVKISSMMLDDNSNLSAIRGIHWEEADIRIKDLPPGGGITSDGFTITDVNGSNTRLAIAVKNQHLTAFLQTVSADEFSLKGKNKPRIVNLRANGKEFLFTNNNTTIAIGRFSFADQRNSGMENFSFKNSTATDSISVVIPAVSFDPDLNAIINGNIVADNVKLVQPVIDIKQISHPVTENDKRENLPAFAIGKLTIQQPEFSFAYSGDNNTRIEWHGKNEKNNFIELTNFKTINDAAPVIEADRLGFVINNLSVTAANKTITTGKGSIRTTISGLYLETSQTNEWTWRALLNELYIKDIIVDNIGKHEGRLEISSALLNDLTVKSTSFLNARQIVRENKTFRIRELSGQFDNTNNHFDWDNLNYDKNTKMLAIGSFVYHPAADKESFIASHKYATDYLTLSTGKVNAGPFDIEKYLTDSVIDAGTVKMEDVSLKVYRDKRKPDREDIVKPMPVNLLKKIPERLSVDTAYLVNTNIEYAELNEKTNQIGTVIVNRMQGKIFPATNYNFRQGDSLSLETQGWLMDSMWISLKLKESYSDPLAGFLLFGNVKPVNAKILNPVLAPLVSAKLESGFMDTLSMRVKGNDYLAIGEMQMYYHDLKVKLLDKGTENKRPFFKRFVNFMANALVIKKNNRSRTGAIYFERLRNKSTMNYLVKIIFSGIGSNIGLKKSKKMLRQYKKGNGKRNLPVIEYD